MQFKIPLKPLTVSNAWQGRRFKTSSYKKWEQDALHFIPKTTVYGPVSVVVELYVKNHKRIDVDNCLKTLLDTLTKSGIYDDDSKIYELHVYKYQSDDEFISICITPYE